MTVRFKDHVLAPGTLAARPAATAVPAGTLYPATDTGITYRSDGTAWSDWLPKKPLGCRATRTTTQSIPYNAVTAIAFTGTDEWDTVGMHDPATNPSRLTVPTGMAGAWSAVVGLGWASAATSDPARAIYFFKNGAFISDAEAQRMQVPSGTAWMSNLTANLLLAAGDYIEVHVKHIITGAVALDVTVAKVSMTYLGATA